MSRTFALARTVKAAGVTGLALLVIAGCGGSSGGSTVADQTPTQTTSTASAPANAPADPAKAKAEITANWETFFDPATPQDKAAALLQNADQLQQALQVAAQARKPDQKLSATVKDVAFTSPTEATVTYDLLINGSPVLAGSTGKAVLVDGTWKVSQTTFCTLTALAASGQQVPGCS